MIECGETSWGISPHERVFKGVALNPHEGSGAKLLNITNMMMYIKSTNPILYKKMLKIHYIKIST